MTEEPWKGLFAPPQPDQLGIVLFGVPNLKNELDFVLSQVIKSVSPWQTYLFFVIPRVVEGSFFVFTLVSMGTKVVTLRLD